ncbi:hypothetical protein GGX14DRAFT_392568 [Mycena pura]|uniref:Uncharacterized protein n=1 Tax=Mycena pura TaxID=153505 RepID=A0AAD6VKB0_9AGAR|nr:hypothetical protein GGX14DRAFT_392568 [Mycena pura]
MFKRVASEVNEWEAARFVKPVQRGLAIHDLKSKPSMTASESWTSCLGIKKILIGGSVKKRATGSSPASSNSKICLGDWDSTPATINWRNQHHWTNSMTGIKLTPVEAIERMYTGHTLIPTMLQCCSPLGIMLQWWHGADSKRPGHKFKSTVHRDITEINGAVHRDQWSGVSLNDNVKRRHHVRRPKRQPGCRAIVRPGGTMPLISALMAWPRLPYKSRARGASRVASSGMGWVASAHHTHSTTSVGADVGPGWAPYKYDIVGVDDGNGRGTIITYVVSPNVCGIANDDEVQGGGTTARAGLGL